MSPRVIAISKRNLAALGALLALLGAGTWAGIRFATAPSGASARRSPGPPRQVAVGSGRPVAYAVVYRVVERGTQLWEVLRVDRPVTGSDLTYQGGSPPGSSAQPLSGSLSTATGLYSVSPQGVQLVSARQPGPPSGDQYLGAELPQLLARGLTRATGEDRTIAGRPCAVYRFAGPATGPVAPLEGSADHDDLCLDADGLVLGEDWTYHGQPALRRVATLVETGDTPVLDSSLPAIPTVTGAQPAGPAGGTIGADPHPSSFLAAPPAPAGFTRLGPALDFRLPDPAAPAATVAASVVWTFVRGSDVITVEAGSERGGALPWRAGDTVTQPVTLAGLGAASTAIRSDGFQLRIALSGGRWVRVLGTVALADLVAYGQELRPS